MKKMNEKLFKNYEKNGFMKIREKNISFEKEKKIDKNQKLTYNFLDKKKPRTLAGLLIKLKLINVSLFSSR